MTKPFTLFGLTGLKASGKDTVADILVSHCGFIKLAFADALYAEVAEAFGVSIAMLQQRDTKELPTPALALSRCASNAFVGRILVLHAESKAWTSLDPIDAPRSPRQILQWWGTEYRRNQSERYWVSKTSGKISYFMKERLHTRFVITDCRFHNEVQIVREGFAGHIWQVTRPGQVAPTDAHASETTGDDFKPEVVIHNSAGIDHLQVLTVGAWLMHDTGLTASDLVRMGLAHTGQASQEWHRAAPTGVQVPEPETMTIVYERSGNCLWHIDCKVNKWKSGVMKVLSHEAESSTMKCLSCGQLGAYPKGQVGPVCVPVFSTDPIDAAILSSGATS